MKHSSTYLFSLFFITGFVMIILTSCSKGEVKNQPPPTVFSAAGDITGALNEFRAALGNLNTLPGATSGRREINWDGVPDALVGKALDNNFFNATEPGAPVGRQRGLVYGSNSGEFQVSSTNFANVDPSASAEFSTFSGDKTFANVNTNLWPATFQVPGQTTPAFTKGVGIVFSDVDLSNSTSLEFFEGEKSLGKFFVAPHNATSSFSFLGVYFPGNERVTKIEVKHDGILADGQKDISAGGPNDLVILDDFIYGEPKTQ